MHAEGTDQVLRLVFSMRDSGFFGGLGKPALRPESSLKRHISEWHGIEFCAVYEAWVQPVPGETHTA